MDHGDEDEGIMITQLAQPSKIKYHHHHQSTLTQDNDLEEEAPNALAEEKEGILFYNELRKHPRILQHTITQIRSKEALTNRQKNFRRDRLETVKQEIK